MESTGKENLMILLRLKVAIKLLLKENPIQQASFNFKGVDLLEVIRKEMALMD